jgi:hypothetical protein
MKSSTLMLLLCMFVFQVQASEGRTINLSGRLCNEHMDATAARAVNDVPEAIAAEASSGMVIVSYDLDGSRQAVNSRIMFSHPEKVFDQWALGLLADTAFAPGVKAQGCSALLMIDGGRAALMQSPLSPLHP